MLVFVDEMVRSGSIVMVVVVVVVVVVGKKHLSFALRKTSPYLVVDCVSVCVCISMCKCVNVYVSALIPSSPSLIHLCRARGKFDNVCVRGCVCRDAPAHHDVCGVPEPE